MSDIPTYDVVIIGAGIQGAGVAQAAAARGYKTLVIEKAAEAGLGTSSKSSKLIHGGLRYLESKQFKLVYECLRERGLLLRNAPELVKLIPFHIPVYKNSPRPAWMIYFGLLIYSLFSGRRFHNIKKTDWGKLDQLNTENLLHVFKYYDAQTDDKELTQTVVASAEKLGANIRYDTDFICSEYKQKHHHIKCKTHNTTISIKSYYLINCAGPWVNTVQKNISPQIHVPDIELIAGTHIVINQPLQQGAYYIQAHDNRAIFVLPWKQTQTMIGTTERPHHEAVNANRPTEEEINYLIDLYNTHFNSPINRSDVTEAFSGLRVLPSNTSSVLNKSRDSLIINKPDHHLITLIGGKLTAYRHSAEKIIQLVKLPIKKPYTSTRNIKL